MSAGFQWGVQVTSAEPTRLEGPVVQQELGELNQLPSSMPRYSPELKEMSGGTRNTRKRRHMEEEGRVSKPLPVSNRRAPLSPVGRSKRTKTPKIYGQRLPVNRTVEVLEKKALQRLIHELIQVHPEITSTVSRLSSKPSVNNSIDFMKEKFTEIMNHLPYKCDVESDYSYMRIKPHLNEFLNSLSDFILSFLPPVEVDPHNSISFLHSMTNLVHGLPNFVNTEFQYIRQTAYEQIANTWHIVLSQNTHMSDEASSGLDQTNTDADFSIKLNKLIEELDLEEKVTRHNESSLGKFEHVLDLIHTEKENFERIKHNLNGNSQSIINDLITVDYSNFSLAARTSH